MFGLSILSYSLTSCVPCMSWSWYLDVWISTLTSAFVFLRSRPSSLFVLSRLWWASERTNFAWFCRRYLSVFEKRTLKAALNIIYFFTSVTKSYCCSILRRPFCNIRYLGVLLHEAKHKEKPIERRFLLLILVRASGLEESPSVKRLCSRNLSSPLPKMSVRRWIKFSSMRRSMSKSPPTSPSTSSKVYIEREFLTTSMDKTTKKPPSDYFSNSKLD